MVAANDRVGPIQWRLVCAIESEHPHPIVAALAIDRSGLPEGDDSVRKAWGYLVLRGMVVHCVGEPPHALTYGCLVSLTEAGLRARQSGGAGRYAEAAARLKAKASG